MLAFPYAPFQELVQKIGTLIKDKDSEQDPWYVYLSKIVENGLPPPLFEKVGTVFVPGNTRPFIPREHFVCDTRPNAQVKIRELYPNFTQWFLGDSEMVLPETRNQSLCYADLMSKSSSRKLVDAVGGDESIGISPYYFWSLLLAQRSGEDGPLLTNHKGTILFLPDASNTLRLVLLWWDWSGAGWNIDAREVTHPFEWGPDIRMVFPDKTP